MQRDYELLVILNYEISDEDIETQLQRIREIITKKGGELKNVNKWGKRRLAYEINRAKKGFYLLVNFTCKPNAIREIEQELKFVEEINRFMTVVLPYTSSFSGANLDMTEEALL